MIYINTRVSQIATPGKPKVENACVLMRAGHHSDSDYALLPLPKSAITWLGVFFQE